MSSKKQAPLGTPTSPSALLIKPTGTSALPGIKFPLPGFEDFQFSDLIKRAEGRDISGLSAYQP